MLLRNEIGNQLDFPFSVLLFSLDEVVVSQIEQGEKPLCGHSVELIIGSCNSTAKE